MSGAAGRSPVRAKLLIDQHGADAAMQAARAALEAEGALTGSATWRRIIKAIEVLDPRVKPGGGHDR